MPDFYDYFGALEGIILRILAPEPFVITVPVTRLDDASFDSVLLRQLSVLYRRLRHEALPLAASYVLIDLRTVRSIFPYAALGLLVLLQGLAPIFQAPIRVLLP